MIINERRKMRSSIVSKKMSGYRLQTSKKKLMAHAHTTLRKDKRVNMRIPEKDLLEPQKREINEGLPYQTCISSIIHKFINGNLVDAKK